ncbi:MAG: CPBP family intramembrane glutamic endopeptidase [Candidatus Hodarchaeota archaeon]
MITQGESELDINIDKEKDFKDFVVNNRLVLFFIFTLLYTWAFWIPMVLIRYGIIKIQVPLIIGQSLGAIGPLVALIILSKASGGVVSLDKILDKIRLTKDRQEIFWLILASLTLPLFTIFGNLLNYIFGEESQFYIIQPAKWEQLGLWLVLIIPITFFPSLLTSPFFEEPGWRGFAVEELQSKFGRHIGSLIIGSYWWLWHQPINIAAGAAVTIYSYFLMIAHSFIIDSLYNLSNRNLLSAMLAHASLIINFTYIYAGTQLYFWDGNLFVILSFIFLIIVLRVIEAKREKQQKNEVLEQN